MDFVKMEGLGNDFIVVDGPRPVTPDEVEAWCDRRRGVGADGVLVVSPVDASTVRMEYWNADGSAAEMCGNGLRCVARYAVDRGMVDGDEFDVVTAAGTRRVVVGAGSVRAQLGPVVVDGRLLELAGYTVETASVGNPHAVAFVDDHRAVPVGSAGPLIETDPAFPGRTNVGFATIVSPDRIDLRVWERGVGETLACGTGAAAATAVAHSRGLTGSRVTVVLPGGPLTVDLVGDEAWIEGPANAVFSGSL
jgi:diaminopimelate epimerase